jgi:hypothetical protein
MAGENIYSFSDPLNSGIDFYQADSADVNVDISISSSLSVSFYQIRFSSIAIAANSNSAISASKIAYASANLSVDGATVIVATERQDGSVSITGDVSLSTNITKIAFSSSSISADSNLSVSGTEILLAQSAIDITSNIQVTAYEILKATSQISISSNATINATTVKFASASLSGSVNLSTSGRIALATIKIILLQNTNVSAKFVKFSSVTGVDSSSIRTLLLLDGKPLTNQNRTLNISSMPVFIENRNWAGNSSRYYKNQTSADKKSFSINWSFIPNFRENTVDERHSRDYIRKLSLDPDIHELRIINQDSDGVTPYTETIYNVFIKDFSENLIRRDMVDNVYYFDCSISLEEA